MLSNFFMFRVNNKDLIKICTMIWVFIELFGALSFGSCDRIHATSMYREENYLALPFFFFLYRCSSWKIGIYKVKGT